MKQPENRSNLLLKALAAISPGCKEAVRLQSEALDHRLPLFQRIGLRLHLLLCKWCRRYGEQITFLRSAAQESVEHDSCAPPQTLSSEARERIKQKVHAHKDSQ